MHKHEVQMGDTKRIQIAGRFLHKSNRWFMLEPFVGKVVEVAIQVEAYEYQAYRGCNFLIFIQSNSKTYDSQVAQCNFNFYGSGPDYRFILDEIFQRMETKLDEVLYA